MSDASTREHTTHFDDCGCLSARKDAEIADLRAKLSAALASERELTIEACAALCMEKVWREVGYGGQWEGSGGYMGHRTGPECAAAIRALKGTT